MFEKNFENPNFREEDSALELTLRPKVLKDYVGQEKIKENLKIYIEAAKKRGEPLDHVLLYGPPGLGKTTLAIIISNELGSNIKLTSGPAIEKAGDLAAILSSLEENDVLFIDEIHRLPKQVEEVLYPAMEDGVIDILIGKGPSARSIRIGLPKFTLIGATTRAGQLSAPLRSRFSIVFRLELYSEKELEKIVVRSAGLLKIDCELFGAFEIGKRARGTPRIANRLLKRCRDFAQILGNGIINYETVNMASKRLGIDEIGLEDLDLRLLRAIIECYGGGPVGLETVAALLCEEAVTIEDVYEPYLMQIGFLTRTSRGRCVTSKAYEYLGIEKIDKSDN